MQTRKQLSFFLENKPGTLAKVCDSLSQAGINIIGFSVSDAVDHAVIRIIVNDEQKAIHLLGNSGLLVIESDVLEVAIPNHPGALQELAEKLSRANINIHYAYGTSGSNTPEAILYMRVSDIENARKILSV